MWSFDNERDTDSLSEKATQAAIGFILQVNAIMRTDFTAEENKKSVAFLKLCKRKISAKIDEKIKEMEGV